MDYSVTTQSPEPVVPQKRSWDHESDDNLGAAAKHSRIQSPTASTTASSPEVSNSSPQLIEERRTCDEAVNEALRVFRDSWLDYMTDLHVKAKEEEAAEARAEKRSADKCPDFRKLVRALLPFAGEIKNVASEKVVGGSYDVVEFRHGIDPPTHLAHYNKHVKAKEWDDALEIQLDVFRASGEHARAWDALCALAAAMSSRKEKTWLDQNDVKQDIKYGLKKLGLQKKPRCAKTKKIQTNAISTMIEGMSRLRIYGYFAHYLAHSSHHMRLSLVRGADGLVPASFVITSHLPFWDALHFHTEDKDSTPFKGSAKDDTWWHKVDTQVALQDINPDVTDNESPNARLSAKMLQSDPKLKELLLSPEPVVLLDVVASLAPRELARSEGVSDVVKAEIERVFSEAKSRGQAVLFELGSAEPHDLAKKVYLKVAAKYGLRCGYLRWRECSEMPWAREGPWDDRGCIGLQMP
jgi:hypothetical protein